MSALWLPILISSCASLALSAIAWRVLPHHAREYRRLPTEPDLLDALRKDTPAPGLYEFPYRGQRGVNTTRADVAANLARGPVGYVLIGKSGSPRVAALLLQYLIFFVSIAVLAAYVATLSGLKDGAPFIKVFRLVSTVTTAALVLGAAPQSIWFDRPWKSWAAQCVDGIACGVMTGAVFGWLWPQ